MRYYIAVEFEVGGNTFRYADSDITVNGTEYRSGLQTNEIPKATELSGELDIEIQSDDDWPGIAQSLHWFMDGGNATLYIIIENEGSTWTEQWYAGLVKGFKWNERYRPITFKISSVEGKTHTLPPEQAVINKATQPPSSVSIRDASLGNIGKPYPLIIGYPGSAAGSNTNCVVSCPLANVKDGGASNRYADLIISYDRIDATSVKVYNVNIGTNSSVTNPATLSVGTRVDKLGQTYSYVALNDGLGEFIDPFGAENDSYVVGFPYGQGGILYENQVLRLGGDIIHWILTQHTDFDIDVASVDTYRSFFNRYEFDTYINEQTDALGWLQEYILKYMPCIIATGPNGVYVAPIPNQPDTVSCRKTLDEGINCERTELDIDTEVYNEITVYYAPNSDVSNYLYQTFRSKDGGRLTGPGIGAVEDVRVGGSDSCAQSVEVYGVKPRVFQLPTVCRKTTADRIADDYAAFYAFPRMTLQYSCDPDFYDTLIGETVLINDSDIGVTGKYGVVTNVVLRPNETIVTVRVFNSTLQEWT